MSPQRDTAYTGIDNLEVMTGARNYNAYLVDLVARDRGECEELVDFGAGSGTYARMLMDRGYTVTCIEPDATLAEKLAHDGLQVSDSIARMSGIDTSSDVSAAISTVKSTKRELEKLRKTLSEDKAKRLADELAKAVRDFERTL